MTDREKAIIMAYTGTAMLTGEKFSIFHKYIEEAKEIGMDSADITNTELSCISALLSDIAMSLAIIADHYTDTKKGN